MGVVSKMSYCNRKHFVSGFRSTIRQHVRRPVVNHRRKSKCSLSILLLLNYFINTLNT